MTENQTKRKSHSYSRWSTDDQESGDSEHRQWQYSLDQTHIKNLNLNPNRFIDAGLSGFKGENLKPNSQWSKLKREIKKGEVVLVENADRITRKGIKALLDELEEITVKKGASVICNGVELDKFNYDKELNTILSAKLGNEESVKKSHRTREGMANQKKEMSEGRYVRHNNLPAWFTHCNENHIHTAPDCYIEQKDKSKIVQEIFNLYLKGYGLHTITKLLNQKHTPAFKPAYYNDKRKFKGWHPQSVGRLLRNKAVIGYNEWVEPPIKLYKPIVDEKTYYAVSTSFDERRKRFLAKSEYKGHRIAIFGRLLQCSTCGGNMIRVNNKNRIYYRCSNSYRGTCKGSGVRADWFIKSFKALLSRSSEMAKLLTYEKPVSPLALDVLNGKLADCKAIQLRLRKILATDNNASIGLYADLKTEEARERELNEEIEKEVAVIKGHTPTHIAMKDYRQYFENKWEDKESLLAIRENLRSMIDRILLFRKERKYQVFFKQIPKPISVSFSKTGCNIMGLEIQYVS